MNMSDIKTTVRDVIPVQITRANIEASIRFPSLCLDLSNNALAFSDSYGIGHIMQLTIGGLNVCSKVAGGTVALVAWLSNVYMISFFPFCSKIL